MKNLTERAKESFDRCFDEKLLPFNTYSTHELKTDIILAIELAIEAERKRIVELIEATRTDVYVYDIDSLLTKINEDENKD